MAGAEEAGARQGMAAGAEEVAAAAKSSNQGVEQIRSDVGISAYSWLKEDIENVVVVDCKAGKARTGLMISSLLLFLKFFPTAEESIEYCNQKRCVDGKGFILPSQIRYVKYFERILTYFNGENQPPRRCMLRGFCLHRCPYWIRPSITVSNHNGVLFSTKKHPRTKELMDINNKKSFPE
ncbi:unnamed protein product [Urochloa humidicola]